jgi:spore germination cell wall hydrolase CwlJ-like protein
MKKIFALVIIALTLVGIFCSCSYDENITISRVEKPDTDVSSTQSTPTPSVKDDSSFLSQMGATSKVEESSEDEVTPYYIVTADERDMLATLVYLESSICSEDCQRAVASVIFNRLDSGRWKKDVNKDGELTLYDIVYYPNAFSPAYLIESYKDKTTQECYDAVDYVIQNGPTVPTYVRYFRTSYHFKWDGYKGY